MKDGRCKCCNGQCTRAVESATVQIELALRESHAPVEQLGETIRQLARILGELSSLPESGSSTLSRQQKAQLAELRRGLSSSIEKLQFHDRMVQHLSHVRDYLASVANQIQRGSRSETELTNEGEQAWDELHLRLRGRLISDAQRELFDLVLASSGHSPDTAHGKRSDYANQGSIELF